MDEYFIVLASQVAYSATCPGGHGIGVSDSEYPSTNSRYLLTCTPRVVIELGAYERVWNFAFSLWSTSSPVKGRGDIT